jgi:CheY-like chemotaxis protein
MSDRHRILVVDDHDDFRHGLEALVGATDTMELVGSARDGADAVRMSLDLQPDVVLMDLHMPGLNGIEATQRIVEASPPKLRNRDVIIARERAHAAFDLLWVCGWLSKSNAYAWLRKEFHRPGVEAHIGRLSIEECARLEARVAKELGRQGLCASGLPTDLANERAKWQSRATKYEQALRLIADLSVFEGGAVDIARKALK